LLEKQIIFVSENLGFLSAVVLSFLPILRPYIFQGPFIPMLPKHMFEYLEAPVPFIIGIAALPEDEQFIKKLEETCIVVYIDQSKISEPKVKMPSLPEPKKIKSNAKIPS